MEKFVVEIKIRRSREFVGRKEYGGWRMNNGNIRRKFVIFPGIWNAGGQAFSMAKCMGQIQIEGWTERRQMLSEIRYFIECLCIELYHKSPSHCTYILNNLIYSLSNFYFVSLLPKRWMIFCLILIEIIERKKKNRVKRWK